jgi:hypothetical protein
MKNTITAITLAAVFTFGATFANAGIILTDRAESSCSQTEKGVVITDFVGVFRTILGIILTDRAETNTCKESTVGATRDRNGIILTDRADGIILTDRSGIILTD